MWDHEWAAIGPWQHVNVETQRLGDRGPGPSKARSEQQQPESLGFFSGAISNQVAGRSAAMAQNLMVGSVHQDTLLSPRQPRLQTVHRDQQLSTVSSSCHLLMSWGGGQVESASAGHPRLAAAAATTSAERFEPPRLE